MDCLRATESPLKLRLPIRRRKADHHLRIRAIQRTRIVPLTRRNGDRVTGIEQKLLLPQTVLQSALEQVQNFIAIGVPVARVRLACRNDHVPHRHRG